MMVRHRQKIWFLIIKESGKVFSRSIEIRDSEDCIRDFISPFLARP
jgi:hypothetical protein